MQMIKDFKFYLEHVGAVYVRFQKLLKNFESAESLSGFMNWYQEMNQIRNELNYYSCNRIKTKEHIVLENLRDKYVNLYYNIIKHLESHSFNK